jgi:hypothetical protein
MASELKILDVANVDLKWMMYLPSHSLLWLRCNNLQFGMFDVMFSLVQYVESFTELHQAHFEIATGGRAMKLKQQLGIDDPVESFKLFIIDSYEGQSFILANDCTSYVDAKSLEQYFISLGTSVNEFYQKRLWESGPPIEEL